jgi:hypothetical protein
MKRRLAWVLAVASLGGGGCIRISPVSGTPHPPWWIGAPAALIAPNSLEGETWRQRHFVLPGRQYIENPPPGPTLEPPPEPLLEHPPYSWDPSHPFTQGP